MGKEKAMKVIDKNTGIQWEKNSGDVFVFFTEANKVKMLYRKGGDEARVAKVTINGEPRYQVYHRKINRSDKVKTKLYHPHTKIKGGIYTQTLSFATKSMADAYAKKRKKEGYNTVVKKEGKGKGTTLYTVYIRKAK